MHLRTYEPFSFISNGLLNSYPSLHHDEKSQIVVVGGGITVALVSHALMEKNYSVILIDRRDIGCGSTATTTSMLQYEIDVRSTSWQISSVKMKLCFVAGRA
jgi:NADH dehydrogenase FAD-containing subunit